MSWDALQREMLEALGHHVYVVQAADGGVAGHADDAAAPPGDDALLHALLRAAGRDAAAPDVAALADEWAPTSHLRTPAAKRALWPRLRTLRKDVGSRGGR